MTQLTREQLDKLNLHPVLPLITECRSTIECLCAKQCKIQICVSEVVGDRFCQPLSDKQQKRKKEKKKKKKKRNGEEEEERTRLRHLQYFYVGVSPTYITASFVFVAH